MMTIRYKALWAGMLGLLALGTTSSAPADYKAGITSAVNQGATGKPPTQELRTLSTGLNVFRDEVIETEANGQAQLLLNDGTALTVGPNVVLVIDEFVYDPETSTGELAMTLSKGVLRFVGGQLSKKRPVLIKTPVATMGIRGGIAIITYDPVTRTATATFLFGKELTITGIDGSTRKVKRSGFTVSVSPSGLVSAPIKATQTQINTVMRTLEGRISADGGATELPTDIVVSQTAYVAAAQESFETTLTQPITTVIEIDDDIAKEAIEEAVNEAILTPVFLPLIPNLPNFGFGVFGTELIQGQLIWIDGADLNLNLILPNNAGTVNFINTTQAFNNGGAFAELDQNNFGGLINFGVDIRVETITVTGADIPMGDFTFFVTNNQGVTEPSPFVLLLTGDMGTTILPFGGLLANGERSQDFVAPTGGTPVIPPPPPPPPGNLNFAVASYNVIDPLDPLNPDVIFIAKQAGNFDDPGAISRGLLGIVDFVGQGNAQISEIAVATTLTFQGNGFSVAVVGTDFDPVTEPLEPFLDFGGLVESSNPNAFVGAAFPNTFNVTEQNFQGRPFTDNTQLFETTNETVRLDLVNPNLANIGLNRRSETLRGYATGIFEARLPGDVFPGSYSLWNANSDPNDLTIFTNANDSSFSATLNLGDRVVVDGDPGTTSPFLSNITVNTVTLDFGTEFANLPPGVTAVISNRGTYIDPDRFGALTTIGTPDVGANQNIVLVNGQFVSNSLPTELYLLTNATDPNGGAVGLLLPGQSFCACPAAKFGWWGGAINVASAPGFAREDRIHAGTFILGNLPDPGDLPAVGTANYAGHVAGTVRDQGVTFAATGAFNANWDFAQRAGSAQITGFAGEGPIDATLAAPVNRRDFTGTLSSQTNITLMGDIRGSFFATATDPTSDMGGVFRAFDDTNVFATGVFAATKQ